MKLGFIGTGKIASSVIKGICKSKIKYSKIVISPRNKKIAENLKSSFKNIIIAKNNQEILEKSNWIFLSVTPSVGEKIIKHLKFRNMVLQNANKVIVTSEKLKNYYNKFSSNIVKITNGYERTNLKYDLERCFDGSGKFNSKLSCVGKSILGNKNVNTALLNLIGDYDTSTFI